MKKFLLKFLFLMCLPLYVFVPLLIFVCPQYTHEYTGSFLDKMRRLESINEPKIILVGNSNLSFGIQSDLMEKALGMPVVNLGLHGGLGNTFHQRMVMFNLRKGDVVVVCHLTYDNRNEDVLQPELVWITLENYFKYWRVLRFKDFSGSLKEFFKYIYRCVDRKIHNLDVENPEAGAYSRSSFNKYGDIAKFREYGIAKDVAYALPEVGDQYIEHFNKYVKFCEKKGARVFIAGYPIFDDGRGFDFGPYDSFQEELSRKAGCPVISDFKNYVFDKDLFYDVNLHLNTEGAKLRTEQLIKDLKRHVLVGE